MQNNHIKLITCVLFILLSQFAIGQHTMVKSIISGQLIGIPVNDQELYIEYNDIFTGKSYKYKPKVQADGSSHQLVRCSKKQEVSIYYNKTFKVILQTFQFLIHIFQTPPAATFKEAQIANFSKVGVNADGATVLSMDVSNTGETILDCAPYLDLVDLGTGESKRIKNKAFTVLPGGVRQINFYLPKETPKGKYSVLGVIDYGSDTDLAGAELNLEL